METINFSRSCFVDDSSQISKVSYDPESQRMRVKFASGDTYEYFNVKREVFGGIVSAESAGVALNKFKGAHLTHFVKL